jgi:hypothetical protein
MKRIIECACVIIAFASLTSACSAADMSEEQDATTEDLAAEIQAVTDPVPGMTVRTWAPWAEGQGHYAGECQTSWKDGTHRLQNLCQVQEYWGGKWHADTQGWMENQDVANGVLDVPRRACTPGLKYTLRTIGRGRVLFAGGWSAIEESISATSTVVCPR